MERPLKRESCLLKIWQAWGPEAQDVQFILKRVSSKASSRRACKVREKNIFETMAITVEDDEQEKENIKLSQVKRTNSKLIKQLAEFEKAKCESEDGSEVQHMQGNIQVRPRSMNTMLRTIRE